MSNHADAAKRGEISMGAPAPGDIDRDYTIGDLAREFGVTLRALRFYEHRGLISPRREGTTRLYDEKDKARLAVILKGKQLGFTLTEIRSMLAKARNPAQAPDLPLSDDQVIAQLGHLEQQRDSVDAAIAELRTKYPHVISRSAKA